MTSDPGSFARHTIVERKPQILQQVIEDNDYPAAVVAALEELQHEIAACLIQPLTEAAPDAGFWNEGWAAHRGRSWLQLPWYFAETYFYRRLLEAVRFWQPGPWQGHDPFQARKSSMDREAVLWAADTWPAVVAASQDVTIQQLLHSALWGNRADLSNYTVREGVRGGADVRMEMANILIDDTAQAIAHLTAGLKRVDVICDNSGKELLCDLALADFLLSRGWVKEIVLHLKLCPFFVSDAMPKDVEEVVGLLKPSPLGGRLYDHIAEKRLSLRDDPFWTSYLMFRQMPPSLASELAEADLVILKGDVNYRRLLDDRHWPHTARLEQIAAYFPAPHLVMRTLKGEIVVGLPPGKADELAAEEPDWLINGKRGIIQYVGKGTRGK